MYACVKVGSLARCTSFVLIKMGLAVGAVAGPGHDGVGRRDWRGRRGDGRGPERARRLKID